ncbi:hypothetical protein EON82_25395 [bacterium]|nr:MAG: hypothetical protein EON82_25395 [bacterium]
MLLDTIKADFKTARLARDAQASALLSSLIGEAEKQIVGNPKITTDSQRDEIVLNTVKKFIDGAKEMIETGASRPELVAQSKAEIEILDGYRPKQMSEDELRAAIGAFKDGNPGAKIGQYMGWLKATYAGQYDGAMAQRLVKEAAV